MSPRSQWSSLGSSRHPAGWGCSLPVLSFPDHSDNYTQTHTHAIRSHITAQMKNCHGNESLIHAARFKSFILSDLLSAALNLPSFTVCVTVTQYVGRGKAFVFTASVLTFEIRHLLLVPDKLCLQSSACNRILQYCLVQEFTTFWSANLSRFEIIYLTDHLRLT